MGAADPYANGASSPWSYTASTGTLGPQFLIPGDNPLFFEPILAARNAWGPIEINQSNGEQRAGDGKALTLNGRTYDRGYGTHTGSELRLSLKGDEQRAVHPLHRRPRRGRRGGPPGQCRLPGVSGRREDVRLRHDDRGERELRLMATDAGNGISYDHADWARPMIGCNRGPDTPYEMDMDPVSARADAVAVTTLHVVSLDPENDSGPVSFTLSNFGPHGEIELVEPDRVYRAATLPADFEVRLRLRLPPPDPDVPAPPLTAISTDLVTQYEGCEDPDYTRRFLFEWHITP